MSFTRSFLLGTVFFRTALPCSGGYHLERGGVPLHDAVGINCKKGATTGNQGSGVKYIGIIYCPYTNCNFKYEITYLTRVFLDNCVCVLSDLT